MCGADTPAEAGVDWEAAAVLRRGRPFLGLGSEWSAVLLCSAVPREGREGKEGASEMPRGLSPPHRCRRK